MRRCAVGVSFASLRFCRRDGVRTRDLSTYRVGFPWQRPPGLVKQNPTTKSESWTVDFLSLFDGRAATTRAVWFAAMASIYAG